jgi:PAS domain-containing protein
MDIICSYCEALIRTVESNLSGVSHAVCRNCLPKLIKDLGQPLSEFVDELRIPILVVQKDMRVVAANAAARRLSPEPLEELAGLLCGEVIGCGHSRESEGCGRTVHCLSCAIRKSVARTIETGEPCHDVPAYPDVGLMSGEREIHFRISTEKKGDFVLLRIDRIRETPKGDPSGS